MLPTKNENLYFYHRSHIERQRHTVSRKFAGIGASRKTRISVEISATLDFDEGLKTNEE